MKTIQDLFNVKVDFTSDFRIAANLGCACAALILLAPFSVNNFFQGRIIQGVTSFAIVLVFAINIWTILRGQFRPNLIFSLLVPSLISAVFFVVQKQGIIGVLWSYPAILGFYFMLTEKQAVFANSLFLLIILPLVWFVLEKNLALRAVITLTLVSILSAIFFRLITFQQRKLMEAKESAEAANKAKSEFLANMSHELRTPLNAVLGFSELMRRDADLSHEQLGNLGAIGRSGEHLLSLINDVLEFSKIEAGRVTLKEENFDLHHLLLGIEEMFQLRAKNKGLSLSFTRGTDVPKYIQTDQNKLRQVLINLLGNAVKFTDTGEVSLSVTHQKIDNDEQSKDCILKFQVNDSGVGIVIKEQDKVFDAFFQANGRQRVHQGTGLGLSISQRFVHMMGGTINFQSKANLGTVFIIKIPVEVTGTPALELSTANGRVTAIVQSQPTYRLLVVEDNKPSRDLLIKLLRSVGFEVQAAMDGREAVEKWQTWKPHLIWMDMRMPVMDGYQATAKIKSLPGGSETVIIALTANAFEEDRRKVIAHGGDDFMRKPFREYEIFDMLTKHLKIKFIHDTVEKSVQKKKVKLNEKSIVHGITSLPLDLRKEFAQAVNTIDYEKSISLIESIKLQNEPLAIFLAGLVEDYNFDILQTLILSEYDESNF